MALGICGILSLGLNSFQKPIAICGTLYLGFAGLLHLKRKERNATESFAMMTDLLIATWLSLLIIVN